MIEDIIKAWVKDSGYDVYFKDPIYYYIKKHWFKKDELIIMTSYPGVMIGKYGETIYKYRDIFKSCGYNYDIKIIELSKYFTIKELKF